MKGGPDHGPDAVSGALPAEEGAARPRGGHPSAARPRGGHRSPPGLTRLTRLSRPTTRWTLRARLASALAPSLAALALAAGAVALGVGPASLGRSSFAAAAGWLGGGDAPAMVRSLREGAFFGWAAPKQARVWVEAAPCPDRDPPARVTLEGARLAALLGRAPPPVGFPLGAGAVVSTASDAGPVAVLDLGSGFMGTVAGGTYARARVVCRSWREAAWVLGALAVAVVDGPAADDLPLRAHLQPQPPHTGVLAHLLLTAGGEAVTVKAVGYAPDGVASGRVLVGVGKAEHWPEWAEAVRRWSEAGARGEVDVGPPPVRPYWLDAGPTPPLVMRDASDLGVVLEPYSAALVAIGTWSFRDPPELLLTFPTVAYEQGGVEHRVGLTEPLRLEWAPQERRSTARPRGAHRRVRPPGFSC